ncbi:uncharacterized protein [Dysidea avara]|uniref:uncharacterized protein isoform X2 n=1 Tax=Dysidea avara TaxID=196820 RepID=UPI00332FAF19
MAIRSLAFVLTSLSVSFALECITDSECIVRPGVKSFAEQVIEFGMNRSNSSFTILVYPGNHTAADRSMNFFNYQNVTVKSYNGTASLTCPNITDTDNNGIGFQDSNNITITGLNFGRCGTITAGLFFFATTNLLISDCSFHHNTDNGIQIVFGNNITIINCYFYLNVGLQPDNTSTLISDIFTNETTALRGVGIGLFAEDQSNFKITITNCAFKDNVAYKAPDYNSSSDLRPYGFIPFGNGGAIYLRLNNVKNSCVIISKCHFYNNTAIHQGGAIVMLLVNSTGNTLDISGSEFIQNKALGGLLRSRNETINGSDVDDFVSKVNYDFALKDFIVQSLRNVSFTELSSSGGVGGAVAVSVYGTSEFNKLLVKDSRFLHNTAVIGSGAIGFAIRESLFDVQHGVNTNHATIDNTFEYNNNNLRWLPAVLARFETSGAIVGFNFPMVFSGTNIFQSNIGGCINHYTITVSGEMKFLDNFGAGFGGAIRFGEVSLMHVLPATKFTFNNNSALQFGGAVGVENVRGSDDTVVLTNFCFIQYNIGSENEYNPQEWKVHFTFQNNTVVKKNGQGQTFFAGDITRCVVNTQENSTNVFDMSIFSESSVFNGIANNNTQFETSPYILIIKNNNVTASPGEVFNLLLYAEDENSNYKDAIYTYQRNSTASPSSILEVDLDPCHENFASFASLSKRRITTQKTLFMTHDDSVLQNCTVNYQNSEKKSSYFTLNLLDSSNGHAVYTATVNINVQCCHVGYEYDGNTGKCAFKYGQDNDDILREDISNHIHIYIRNDRYGGFDSDGYFVTARIPPSYQNCTQEGRLSGCLVKDDDLDQQCSQGRTGFLCGKCPKSSNRGTALSLIECRSCGVMDIVLFIFVCLLIVVGSFCVMYYNVGLSNALKGVFFFIQVVCYVYNSGVSNGQLHWHFYLSRFFGYSLFVPLCLSSSLDAVEAAMIGFVSPALILITVAVYIFLARYVSSLSRRKTVDGIWFLVLITFVYTADTCLILLRCVQVYEPFEFKGKRVYYYDGTLQCFAGQHLPYGLIALLILVLVLIPFVLYVLVISFSLIKSAGPIRDVVSSGIETKYPWWSGYDLFRRLLFYVMFLMFENFNSDYTQFAETFTALLILVITARVRPYIYKWVNFIEVLILLDLVLISVYNLDTRDPSHSNITVVLLILPFVYFVLYSACFVFIRIFRKRLSLAAKDNITIKTLKKLILKRNEEQPTSIPNTDNIRNSLTVASLPSDVVYAQYRDELDDFVTVKDHY